ncbi:MAG: NUDIX domain-containing protein [Nostoc sp.]|uniref:NUDIX hydrolase n=1 Tax=Nostoc sp. TaxID=1180 RepID=UPI002FF93128
MKISVFAAIFNKQKKVLCVRRNYGARTWTTPGGGIESGESPFDAVEREAYEEVKYRIKASDLIGVYSIPSMDDYVILLAAEVIEVENWSPSEEISDMGYFSLDELPQPMHIRTATRIQDAFEGKRGVLRVFSVE